MATTSGSANIFATVSPQSAQYTGSLNAVDPERDADAQGDDSGDDESGADEEASRKRKRPM